MILVHALKGSTLSSLTIVVTVFLGAIYCDIQVHGSDLRKNAQVQWLLVTFHLYTHMHRWTNVINTISYIIHL